MKRAAELPPPPPLSETSMERRIRRYLREIERDANPNKVYLKMRLNPDVPTLNATLTLLIFFIVPFNIYFQMGFCTRLLGKHYHVHTPSLKEEVAHDLGYAGAIAYLSGALVSGFLLDLFGRKYITVAGLVGTSLITFVKPLPSIDVLDALYAFRIAVNVGLIPCLYTPYTLDFVRRQSLGLLMGFYVMIIAVSGVCITLGLIFIDEDTEVGSIYFGMSGITFLVALILAKTLRDNTPAQVKAQ